MLQTIREKTSGWIAGVVLGLLAIPFVFFGVNNYFDTPVENWVAKVGDAEITSDEFRARFEQYRQQMRQSQGAAYDGREIEKLEVKKRVLDGMIDEELLAQAGARLGVVVTAEQLQKEIGEMEVFHTDGRFDPQQYKLLLATQNMSPRAFEASMRRDLETRAMAGAIASSSPIATAEIEQFIKVRDQTRDVRYFEVVAPQTELPTPDDEQLKAYFDKHAEDYVSEETVVLEYVQVEAAKLEVPTVADEETLRQRYDEQASRFTEPEQRLASHILIRVPADAPAETQQAAQAKAAELATKAREEGADFAKIAGEHSEDPGSKSNGGDLGWIETGFTDPAFEAALFAMQPGTVSDPIKTNEGWHVIQLRELRPGKVKTFEDVRGELETDFLSTERERRYNELAGRLVDIVYRDPSTLAAAADELSLPVQKTPAFGREGGFDALTRNPDVQKFAFSPQAIREQQVSDPIALDGETTVAVRVAEHAPSRPYTLEEIKDQVIADWQRSEREAATRAHAESLLAQVKAGTAMDALATAEKAELKSFPGLGRNGFAVEQALIQEIFGLPRPEADKPLHTLIDLPPARQVLLELTAVHDGDPTKVDATQRTALRQQMAQAVGAAEAQAWVRSLREQSEVRVAEDRL